MDASKIHSKRLNAKEVMFPQKGEFTFPIADGRIKTPGGDQELRTSTLIRPDQIEERVTLTVLEKQKGLFHNLTTHFRMPVKRQTIFGPCREASYTAITLNPESNFARREKMDVKQEKRINDYWNIDGSRDLSDPWTDFTQ